MIETYPAWALTLTYWLHMLGTVVWIGGLSVFSLLVLPAASKTLQARDKVNFLLEIQKRMNPLAWFSLALLVGTGMMQMSINPNYSGFLAINSTWGMAIFIKHLLFLAMVAISAYQTWGLMPALRRATLRQAKGMDDKDAVNLQRSEVFLVRINLGLGVLVLLLTALARIS
jgi:uncharacterized membrane protein